MADYVLADSNRYAAVRAILGKQPPSIKGHVTGAPIVDGSDLLAATIRSVSNLRNSYVVIQGPPGAGKTYTSAHIIVELLRMKKKVGVAANSHKAIHNVLDKVEAIAKERGVTFQGVKKSSRDNPDTEFRGQFIRSESTAANVSLDADLIAGTAWLFADPRFDQHLDFLLIDEAGQVSIANVVAMGTAARNVVLVGDQMQLGQPIQGVHPGQAGLSILDFLLGELATVPPDRGIFLDRTWRLHPSVCSFVSEAFYDGRLLPHPDNVKRRLEFKSSIKVISPEGIHLVPVSHAGCSQKSEEEGRIIGGLYSKLLGQKFIGKDGTRRDLSPQDLMVVAPYNVQVNYLKSILPAGARVGTVDKFQGQEAPVVFVSMTTSDAECMPRDIEFLFSANRLNVAVSRAQCLAIVVANPKLLETPCRTIRQMKLVNKFCQLADFAEANKQV